MAVVQIHIEPIAGPWASGFVLDKHVISSVPTGYVGDHMQFDTVRTVLGERVYRFKNKGGPPDDIVDTAAAFVQEYWAGKIDCVIAPPPSKNRLSQPAAVIASGVATALGIEGLTNVVAKVKATPQMKNVALHERPALLAEALQAGVTPVQGRSVLIIDDLWDTGGTMRRVAQIVNGMGANAVRALALTRTK